AKPGGSILAWQAAQDGFDRCWASISRMVVVPRTSGSMAGTSPGGGSGGRPTIFRMTQAPRLAGEGTGPLAGTLTTAAWGRTPPRPQPAGSGTRRIAEPETPGMR